MSKNRYPRLLGLVPLLGTLLLGGCNMTLLNPTGQVGLEQRNLIITATLLMLLVVVPVIVMTFLFAWKYRASNKNAVYTPKWSHSTKIEVAVWTIPVLIIIALGYITYKSTHSLDPYRPIESDVKPVTIEVVALDWKWLFIYPEQGIATVNELAAPVDRPIEFKITASTVMNSFYVPALAGQVYAMPGMQTQLHAVINKAGEYEGFSANYSGAGFSNMRFTFHGLSNEDFAAWVQSNKKAGGELTRDGYLEMERPSQRVPVQRFAKVSDGLFDAIVNRCVEAGKMCMSEMAAIDAKGGMGPHTFDVASRAVEGDLNQPLSRRYVMAQACTADEVRNGRPATLQP